MDNKITMEGKYAYRKDPFTQVRILCVDRSGGEFPVVSMDSSGHIKTHPISGEYDQVSGCLYDLVPLQVKLPDLWVNLHKDGELRDYFFCYSTKGLAESQANKNLASFMGTYHYIPAPDQTS